jgi:acyl carrier protein
LGGEVLMKLQETVFKTITEELQLPTGVFTLETPLEELGIDSLKAITILYELEDRLGIEIPNEVFDSIKNVGDIVQQLRQIIASKDTVCLDE